MAFTPLLGLHLFIIVFVAFIFQRLIRFNKAMAIAVCYVNNPLTFAPMLWASYEVGARLVPSAATKLNARELPLAFDWHGGIQSIPSYLVGIGLPMLIGCLVLGGVLAALTYPVTYALVRWYRRGESSQLPDSTFESVDSPRTSNSQAQ